MAVEHLSQMTLATMMPVVFGDERDQVLKKFNQIQACWGVGKGVYNASSPFVVFGNQYNKFKVSIETTHTLLWIFVEVRMHVLVCVCVCVYVCVCVCVKGEKGTFECAYIHTYVYSYVLYVGSHSFVFTSSILHSTLLTVGYLPAETRMDWLPSM